MDSLHGYCSDNCILVQRRICFSRLPREQPFWSPPQQPLIGQDGCSLKRLMPLSQLEKYVLEEAKKAANKEVKRKPRPCDPLRKWKKAGLEKVTIWGETGRVGLFWRSLLSLFWSSILDLLRSSLLKSSPLVSRLLRRGSSGGCSGGASLMCSSGGSSGLLSRMLRRLFRGWPRRQPLKSSTLHAPEEHLVHLRKPQISLLYLKFLATCR